MLGYQEELRDQLWELKQPLMSKVAFYHFIGGRGLCRCQVSDGNILGADEAFRTGDDAFVLQATPQQGHS